MSKQFVWLIVLLGLLPIFLLVDCQESEALSGSSLIQESGSLGLGNQVEVEEEVPGSALTRSNTDNPILPQNLMAVRVVGLGGQPLADANIQIHSFENGLELDSYATGQDGMCAIDLGEATVAIVTIQHETTVGVTHGAHLLLRDNLSPTIPTDLVAGSERASVIVLLKKANVPATEFAVDIFNDMEVSSADVDSHGAAFFLIPPEGIHTIFTYSRNRKTFVLVDVSLVQESPSVHVISIPNGSVRVHLSKGGLNLPTLEGIKVTLSKLPLLPDGYAVPSISDLNGQAEYFGVSPGRYMVSVNPSEVELGQRSALIAPTRAEVVVGNGRSDVALEISEAAIIQVAVFRADGRQHFGEVFVRDLTVGSIVDFGRSRIATRFTEVELQVPPGEIEVVAWQPQSGWGVTRLTTFPGETSSVEVHLSQDEPSLTLTFPPGSSLHPDKIIVQDDKGSPLAVWRRPGVSGIRVNGKLIDNPLHEFDENGHDLGLIPLRFEAIPKGEITVLSLVHNRIVETFAVEHWKETELGLMAQE
jgi:hypothetical protein